MGSWVNTIGFNGVWLAFAGVLLFGPFGFREFGESEKEKGLDGNVDQVTGHWSRLRLMLIFNLPFRDNSVA